MTLELPSLKIGVEIDDSKVTPGLRKATSKVESEAKRAKANINVAPVGSRDLERAGDSAKRLSGGLEQAARSAQNVRITPSVADDLGRSARGASELESNLKSAGTAGQNMRVSQMPAQELERAGRQAGFLRESLEQAKGALAFGAGMAGIAGVGTAFSKTLSLGNDFTDQMNILQAVSGATGDALGAAAARARELGNDAQIPATSAGDAALAMAELAKGGFSVDQSMQAARGTLQLAAAAGVSAGQAATIQSQALQSFGLQADYAAKASDVLANSANASSAEITDIAQGMQQSGAVAHSFGMSLEDTAATLSLFANAGIKGSDAGTLIKSALLAIANPSKPAQRAIEELGLTINDANGQFVGMSKLFGQLHAASERMTPAMYQQATATLFGSDAMRLASVAAEQGAAGWDQMRVAMDRQGAAADVAAARSQGLPGAIAAVGNSAEEVALKLYDLGKGPAESGLRGLSSGIDAVSSAIDKMPTGVWAAGAGLLLAKFTGLNEKMPAVVSNVRSFGHEVSQIQKRAGRQGKDLSGIEATAQALSKHSTVFAQMNAAYARGAAPLGKLAAEHRQAAIAAGQHAIAEKNVFTAVDLMGQRAAHSFAASAEQIGSTAMGLTSGAFNGLKQGIGGAIDMLGGPWGIAIAGATFAFAELQNASQRAKDAQEAITKAQSESVGVQNDLRAALHASSGEMNEQARAAAEEFTKNRITGMMEQGKQLTTGLVQNNRALMAGLEDQGLDPNEASHRITLMSQGFKELKSAMEELQIPQEDLNKVIAAGGPEFDQLVARLNNSGEAGQLYAQKLTDVRSELEKTSEAALRLDPATASIADGFAQIGKEGATAQDKLQGLNKVLQGMGFGQSDVEQVERDTIEMIEEVSNSAAKLVNQDYGVGDSLFNADGGLDWKNKNAGALADQLTEMSNQLKQVGMSGGDVQKAFDDMQPALESLWGAFQVAPEKVQPLLDSFQMVPDEITVALSVEEGNATAEQLAVAWADLKNKVEGDSIELPVDDQNAIQMLRDLGYQVEQLDGGNIQITAQTDEARDRIGELVQQVNGLGDNPVSVSALLDTSQLEGSGEHAQEILDTLDAQISSPRAELIKDNLENGVDISVSDLAYLSSQSATPFADLMNDPLVSKLGANEQQLQNLSAQTFAPTVDANTQPAESKLQRLWDWIKSIGRSKTTVTPQVGHYLGGVIQQLAVGGTAGYRLPTSGPGTEIIDGFLGVDGAGVPIARVSRGEFVVNERQTEKHEGALWALNAGNPFAAAVELLKSVPALAEGGLSAKVKAALAPFDGNKYTMGGFSLDSMDCSGAVSAGVNAALDLPPLDSRMNTTVEGAWLANKGFEDGRGDGDDLVVAWYDKGGGAYGHTAMMLPDGTFIESGGNTGGGLTIGGKAGPLDGRGFTNFMHLPVENDDLDDGELTGDLGASASMGTPFSASRAPRAKADNISQTSAALDPVGSAVRVTSAVSGLSGAQGALGRALQSSPGWGEFEGLARSNGFDMVVDALKNASVPLMLSMSDETISAFNELGKSRADRENAALDVAEAEEELAAARKKLAEVEKSAPEETKQQARKIADAEKALEEARNSSAKTADQQASKQEKIAKAQERLDRAKEDAADALDKANSKHAEDLRKAQDNVANATAKLTQARSAEEAAISALQLAQQKLDLQMLKQIVDDVVGVVNGGFEGVAAAATLMHDSFSLLASNMQHVNELIAQQVDQQAALATSGSDLFKARQTVHDQQSKYEEQHHSNVLAVQSAEMDLALSRINAANTVGATEVDLNTLRKQGIFNVFQVANETDKAAIISASEVAKNESKLQAARVELAKSDFNNKQNVANANSELELAEELARIQMERLSAASDQLAASQAKATDALGGATSLEKYVEALKQLKKAEADKAAAGTRMAQGAIPIVGWFGENGIAGVGKNVASLKKAEREIAQANERMTALRSEAMKELEHLPAETQAAVRKALKLSDQPVTAGTVFAAISDVLFNTGGSNVSAALTNEMLDALSDIDLINFRESAQNEAADLKAKKKKEQLDLAEKRARVKFQEQQLNAQQENWDSAKKLDDLNAHVQAILKENEQENSQLGRIHDAVSDRNRSVIMSVGGSQWGAGPVAAARSFAGGFAGLRAGDLSLAQTASVEDQWLNAARERMLVPIIDHESELLAKNRAGVGVLPDTVVGSWEKQKATGVTPVSDESVRALTAELARVNKGKTTTFTGDVHVDASRSDRLLSELQAQLVR